MTSWEFPGSDPIDILIDIPAGSIAVSAEPTTVTTVGVRRSGHGGPGDPEVQVSFAQGRLEIIQPTPSSFLRGHAGVELTVKVPPGSRCTVRSASADVSCVGELAGLQAKTASGDVTAASVSGPLAVTTASGDVWLETGGAAVEVRTASGNISLREAAGDASLHTASGDIQVGTAAASVQASTASGDVHIGSVAGGQTSVKTVSGDTAIGVAAGASTYLDLSSLTGRIKNQLEETDGGDEVGLRVTCRSVSGDIQIARAQ
jgi:Putative adhesin